MQAVSTSSSIISENGHRRQYGSRQCWQPKPPATTPADIKYLLNESLRYALFAGRAFMTYDDFRQAQPEHHMGIVRPLNICRRKPKNGWRITKRAIALAVRLFLPHHRIARNYDYPQGQLFGHVSIIQLKTCFRVWGLKRRWKIICVCLWLVGR